MFHAVLTPALLSACLLATSGQSALSLAAAPSADTSAARALTPVAERGMIGVYLGESEGSVEIQELMTGSPAAAAGLEAGDRIKALNGTTVSSASELSSLVSAHEAGEVIRLRVERDGWSKELELALAPASLLEGAAQEVAVVSGEPIRVRMLTEEGSGEQVEVFFEDVSIGVEEHEAQEECCELESIDEVLECEIALELGDLVECCPEAEEGCESVQVRSGHPTILFHSSEGDLEELEGVFEHLDLEALLADAMSSSGGMQECVIEIEGIGDGHSWSWSTSIDGHHGACEEGPACEEEEACELRWCEEDEDCDARGCEEDDRESCCCEEDGDDCDERWCDDDDECSERSCDGGDCDERSCDDGCDERWCDDDDDCDERWCEDDECEPRGCEDECDDRPCDDDGCASGACPFEQAGGPRRSRQWGSPWSQAPRWTELRGVRELRAREGLRSSWGRRPQQAQRLRVGRPSMGGGGFDRAGGPGARAQGGELEALRREVRQLRRELEEMKKFFQRANRGR